MLPESAGPGCVGSFLPRRRCITRAAVQHASKAVHELGLPAGTSSHDLRHHYASLLLAAGESVVAVAERLGHEDASLVLSTYGYLMPGSDDRTRRAVDAAWCAPDVPSRVAQASGL